MACGTIGSVDFEGGNQSSNGGALLLRESERDVGVCRRLAGAMPDRRDPDHIQHQMVEMVTARVTRPQPQKFTCWCLIAVSNP